MEHQTPDVVPAAPDEFAPGDAAPRVAYAGNRFDEDRFQGADGLYWADLVAEEVIRKFPDRAVYTCAAGISPSGIVHFGNLRDVMIAHAVHLALLRKGKNARLLFSWDDFDRFRKVPAGLPSSMVEHIGKPLTSVPDPMGDFDSYAERHEDGFQRAVRRLGITLDYRYQTPCYASGQYAEWVDLALRKRAEIAKILYDAMSDIGKEEKQIVEREFVESFYPVSVYSRFTNKDKTNVLGYENFLLTYECLETGKTDTVDIRQGGFVKLSWKVDWPMRWMFEGVAFEPGGHDHASPGGSYDVSSRIAREIFGIEPPVFVGYQFIGIQGRKGKMSGSKGGAITPGELLDIYEPEILKWLYLRREPNQTFNLAFDAEIIRQYDEFDAQVKAYQEGGLLPAERTALELSFEAFNGFVPLGEYHPVSFKQVAGFGQIVHWNNAKLAHVFSQQGIAFDRALLNVRLEKAHDWLATYNPERRVLPLASPNLAYFRSLDEEAVAQIGALVAYLRSKEAHEIADLEETVYAIPKVAGADAKQNAVRQRQFFKHVYTLLLGSDTGPRLATYLWALPLGKTLSLLDLA